MKTDYSFMGNTEPSDEQLHLLMKEVVSDVKKRAKKSLKNFYKQLDILVKQRMEEQFKTDKKVL